MLLALLKVSLGVAASLGGVVVILGVLTQAGGAQAAQTAPAATLVRELSVPVPVFRHADREVCAGRLMFNTTAPLYKWDSNPIHYRIKGAVGDASSKGTGLYRHIIPPTTAPTPSRRSLQRSSQI